MNQSEFSILISIVRERLNSGKSIEDLDYPDEDVAEALWIIQEEQQIEIPEQYEYNKTR